MSPGLVGSELAATPPHYSYTKMEESLFPSLVRKSAISVGSENDPNDYCNNNNYMERKLNTRGSVPASLSSSPIKFPTIDRANSTSIASLPGSRATRHRSQARELRASYCRSPSCPSHLDVSRNFSNHLDFSRYRKDSQKDLAITRSDSSNLDEAMKLPNIFNKNSECHNEPLKQKNTRTQEKSCDRKSSLTLRRSESMVKAFDSMRDIGSSTDRDPQRNQTSALLLPLNGDTIGNRKKKKKRRQRVHQNADETGNVSKHTDDDEVINSSRRFTNDESEEALDALALENTYKDGTQSGSPRAIEVSSSHSVKQWIGGNRNSQTEGQIKV